MGFLANRRSAMNVFRLQQEWGALLRQPEAVTRIELKPVPRLAFGSAAVAEIMVTADDGHFVLENTAGTFLPDKFTVNSTARLADESASGAAVFDAIISHYENKADSLNTGDRAGRVSALATAEWFAWILGDDRLERKFVIARGRELLKNPTEQPKDYDGIIRTAERLGLMKLVRYLRTQQANAVTQLALDDANSEWSLEDARATWRQVIGDHKRAGMTESLEDVGETIRELSLLILDRDRS